jgi:hypothetical protein
MISPSGRKVTRAERKKEEKREKTPLIGDTEFRGSACKLLGPKTLLIVHT